MKVAVIADQVDQDLGLLHDYFCGRGATILFLDRTTLLDADVCADMVLSLGSNRSAHERRQLDVVTAEVVLLRRILNGGTPVMGICYGAQILARALGGSSERGTLAECGWKHVLSEDEELCPSGFWGQMHHDVFLPAESSDVIGWNAAGPQSFIDSSRAGHAIGWQFHPELTLSTLERWLNRGYSGSEGSDTSTILTEAASHAAQTARRAPKLFESALSYLGIPPSC